MERISVKTDSRVELIDITGRVFGGDLAFGAWQGIYFCEGDGPRQREARVKILGDRC